MPSDFKADMDFNTPPDADNPMEIKLAYQRHLRKRWEAMTKPSDILAFPDSNGKWWLDPHGIDPAVIAQQQLKRLKRSMGER
jgi:hypothetical protein